MVINRVLFISKYDFELHMKRNPNFCFVNNSFNDGLSAWKANMNIQSVFNEYKAKEYICLYSSKNEVQYSQVMKEEAKEAFENNLHHYESVKTTSQANLSKHKYSAQEDVYHIFPELKLRRVFPAVHFVYSNQVKERTQVLLFEKDMFLRIFFKNLMLICI